MRVLMHSRIYLQPPTNTCNYTSTMHTHITRRHLLLSLLTTTLPCTAAALASPESVNSLTNEPLFQGLSLANVWSDTSDPTGFLVSEKYDGVRGVWDGRQLRFRSGRVVSAPTWFTAQLPPEPLDGELWLGRGRFDEVSGLVRKETPVDNEWLRVKYMVFELPPATSARSEIHAAPFSQRVQRINQIVQRTAWSQLVATPQSTAANPQALQQRLADTVAQGGEGLMLHLAAAPYTAGRSAVLLKLKPSLDTEATVIGYQPGKGKYRGLVGALKVRSPEGREFLIGTGLSDADRRAPPPLGSSVTYRFRHLTNTGLPRFASFMRVHSGL
jgi:DNA ligase 1